MIGYIKYSLVGVLGATINFSTLWFMTEKLHYWYLLSATIGIFVAATFNYILNYLWTFGDRKHQIKNRWIGWLKFLASILVTEGAYLYLVYLFTSKLGIYYILSAFISLALTSVIRYVTANKWVWAGEPPMTKLEILEAGIRE